MDVKSPVMCVYNNVNEENLYSSKTEMYWCMLVESKPEPHTEVPLLQYK